MLEDLSTAAKQMSGEVLRALRGGSAPSPELRVERANPVSGNVRPAQPGWGLRPYWWAPAAGAGLVVLAGTVFAAQARTRYSAILDAPSYADAAKEAEAGKLNQALALASYGAAGLGLTAAALFFFSGDPAAQPLTGGVRLVPAANGVALTWSWP